MKIPQPPFMHARVVGGGAMGASLALALRERGVANRIDIVDPDAEALRKLASLGFEIAGSLSQSHGQPDVVFLAAPPGTIPDLLVDCARLYPDALLADLASIKRIIFERASFLASRNPDLRFVGCHPLSGTEKSGVDAARADLFSGRSVVITTLPEAPEAIASSMERTWQLLGAIPIRLSPEEHDHWLALTSHLPVLVAAALCRLAASKLAAQSREEQLIGPGFLDTTRVAASSPRMWQDILTQNWDQLRPLVKGLRQELEEIEQLMDAVESEGEQQKRTEQQTGPAVQEWLQVANEFRRRLGES